MRDRPLWYVLDRAARTVRGVSEMPRTAFQGGPDHVIARTTVAPGIDVSTVFLFVDHNFGSPDADPVLFETMVFGLEDDDEWSDYQRYTTLDAAEEGHWDIVDRLRGRLATAIAKIPAPIRGARQIDLE